MAWNDAEMFWGRVGNHRCNHGKYSFSGTDTTVEVPVRLTRIFAAHLVPLSATSGVTEVLYTDMTVTNGAVTVTRYTEPIILSTVGDDAVHVSTNDWVDVPIGRVPVAGTISRLTVYNKTSCSTGANGYIKLGNVISDGTKDVDDHMTGAGTTKEAFPADGEYKTIASTSDAFDGAAGTAVAAGDLLILGSVSGATTPSGLMAEVEITPTPTSGLEFAFMFIGL